MWADEWAFCLWFVDGFGGFYAVGFCKIVFGKHYSRPVLYASADRYGLVGKGGVITDFNRGVKVI